MKCYLTQGIGLKFHLLIFNNVYSEGQRCIKTASFPLLSRIYYIFSYAEILTILVNQTSE